MTTLIVKLQWLYFHFEYFLKLSVQVFSSGAFLLVIFLIINLWNAAFTEKMVWIFHKFTQQPVDRSGNFIHIYSIFFCRRQNKSVFLIQYNLVSYECSLMKYHKIVYGKKVQKKINLSSLRLINCQTPKLGRTQSIQSRRGLKRKWLR